MVALRPEPERTIPEPVLPLVEVFPVIWGEVPLAVMAQGTVRPHRETQLMAEVAGRITRVSPQFREGATFAAGNVLVEIDPTDFEAALAQARQQSAQAQLTLAQEVNQARQAREDWQRLGGQAEMDPLVLREPQLAVAEAAVASAQAAVRVAERNLARRSGRLLTGAYVSRWRRRGNLLRAAA